MPEFLNLVSPQNAKDIFLNSINPLSEDEDITILEAIGRVTTRAVSSPIDLPEFNRSTVDGYALLAQDTFGASELMPAYIQIIGEVPMGVEPDYELIRGTCTLIHTGGMVPREANAIAMLEDCQITRGNELEVYKPVAIGENILKIGEDINKNDEVISSGTRLRSPEIGGLAAIGVTKIKVAKKPRIGILSTGDEVISPDKIPELGEVRDINTYTLKSMVDQYGATGMSYGIMRDDYESVYRAAMKAIDKCDMVVFTAGSSASSRDITVNVIDSLGDPGTLVHGINIRPGKPTILASCQGKPVVGLPGNPVSCLVIAWLYVKPAIDKLVGLKVINELPPYKVEIGVNIPSKTGREDWISVILQTVKQGVITKQIAYPRFSRSNLIFSLVNAEGLVRIPDESNGVEAGQIVDFYPLY